MKKSWHIKGLVNLTLYSQSNTNIAEFRGLTVTSIILDSISHNLQDSSHLRIILIHIVFMAYVLENTCFFPQLWIMQKVRGPSVQSMLYILIVRTTADAELAKAAHFLCNPA